MIYFLLFIIIVCLFFLIKKEIEIKRQKRIILQHELLREHLNSLLNKITLYGDLDSQIQALEYILQNLTEYETNRQNTSSVR